VKYAIIGYFEASSNTTPVSMENVTLIVILAVVLFLIGLASHLISKGVFKRLQKAGNNNATGWRIIVFIASFVLILGGLWLFIVYEIPWGR
jgi:membrane protease YdiL (CAAX protease family)